MPLLAGSLLFAVVTSLACRVYPAARAAKTDPIQALHAE
jgi:ABC-type lipoprotein release transport system permease subunit